MDFSFLFLLTYHKAVGHYGKSLGLYYIAISIHGLLRITTLSVWGKVWPVEKTTILSLFLTAALVCARHAGLGSSCMMQARKAVESHALLPC